MIRLFIAFSLPNEIRNELGSIIEALRSENDGIKWVRPENIHLTLRFIGDTKQELIKDISNCIDASIQNEQNFDMSLDRLGAFPNLNRPRTIWAAPSGDIDRMRRIVERLEKNLQSLGIEEERKNFKPHLTLGRVRNPASNQRLTNNIETFKHRPLPFTLDNVILYQSTLTPKGPIYKKRHIAKLGVERMGG